MTKKSRARATAAGASSKRPSTLVFGRPYSVNDGPDGDTAHTVMGDAAATLQGRPESATTALNGGPDASKSRADPP
jgi:hypothetical protein